MINKNIIINTIEKEYRNKGIITLFIFTILFILAGHALAIAAKEFVVESNLNSFIADTSQGIILSFVSFATNIVTIFIAISAIKSDVDSNLIGQVLSFPITRFGYVVNRVLGSCLLSISFYLISSIFGFILLSFSGSMKFDLANYLLSLFFMSLQILGMTVMGIIFSLYVNKIGSFIFTFFYYVFSKIVYHSVLYNGISFEEMGVFKVIQYAVHFLTPRVGELSYISEQVLGKSDFLLSTVTLSTLHFAGMTIVWLFVIKVIFEKREF